MCLILIAWKSHPRYPVIIAANRDEFYERPSTPAHFWKEAPDILAGRDIRQGGTWLGINRDGRFAAITNFRGSQTPQPGKRSRGELVASFLMGDRQPAFYSQEVARRRTDYNPFNLLVGSSQVLGYCDSSSDRAQTLPPGLYALGNNRLDQGADKETAGIEALRDTLYQQLSVSALIQMLRNEQASIDSPNVLERGLSARFIHLPDGGYGTRASTALLIDNEGHIEFAEQNYDDKGRAGELQHFQLQVATKTL